MRKVLKTLMGLLLLPFVWGGAVALWRVLQASGGADCVWVPLVAGAVCWAAVYLLLPRPMWLYVAGHELTHAMWAWLFGGRVRQLKVSSKGGHVVVSKTNFLIALAPYFFPFYAGVIVIAGLIAQVLLPWNQVEVWFLLMLGAAYAFHVTLTGHVLKTRQSDITENGFIFSGVIILLGNLLVLVLALPLLTGKPAVPTAVAWWWEEIARLLQRMQHWLS